MKLSYRSVVARMRRRFPTAYPLSVRRTKLTDGLDGYCQLTKDGKFLIKINKQLEEHEAIETFLHELAHACAWDSSKDDHCDEWGKAYSRIYRVFLSEFMD